MRKYVDINQLYPSFINIGGLFITKRKCDQISNFITEYYGDLVECSDEFTLLTNSSGEVIMSNGKVELLSNYEFIQNAEGDIIVFGLGLGLIIFPLLSCNLVKSITIVEKNDKIINYVGSVVKKMDLENKVSLIHSDAHSFVSSEKNSFDYIYFDIWNSLNENSFEEMEQIQKNFQYLKRNEKSRMRSWGYELKDLILSEIKQ